MATKKTKVYAPDGYHFMIRLNGSFYLQIKDYTPHTLSNGDKSSPYVMMQYSTEHPTAMVSNTAAGGRSSTPVRRASTTASRTTTRTTTPVRSTITRTSTSSGSSSGSSSSGGY